ncbi:MAG: nucleotide exchange factor GrpE [Deltaproteobacteria bacterium]|nr:nucleotide exchange factor GrpE [Deltaproteobacteria bacterium]
MNVHVEFMHWNLDRDSCKVPDMDEENRKTGEKKPSEEDPGKETAEKASDEEPKPSLMAKEDSGKDAESGAKEPPEEKQEEKQKENLKEKQEEKSTGKDEKAAVEKAEKSQATDELLKTRERMLRIAADFENFRKRSKKDLQDAEHKARVDILKEMLPVFDNLARAVEHGASVKDLEPIIQGARMVTKQFEENLAKFGLKRIESVGKGFDPTIHDAISQEESEEAKPGTIIKEFLAGYTLGDKLLRAAMVVVAKAGQGGGKKKDEDGEKDEGEREDK